MDLMGGDEALSLIGWPEGEVAHEAGGERVIRT